MQRARNETASSPGKPRSRGTRPLDIALQGGGAHGAFTWGVLDRLLEDQRIAICGISGTSAGAMNAVVLASGLLHGGNAGARDALREFWSQVASASANPLSRGLFGAVFGNAFSTWSPMSAYFDFTAASRILSPYQFNPFNLNPLRDIVADIVDFEAIRASDLPRLFVAATHVRSGRMRIFRNAELSVDALMASACLPTLFQAVEIDGEAYWDGGYMGNPSLFPLIEETPANDLLLVQVNPSQRETVPTRSPEILERIDEITFQGSLIKELRTVAMLQRLIRAEGRPGHQYREPLFGQIDALSMHRLEGGETLGAMGASSKLDTDWTSLQRLHREGYASADAWLSVNFTHLGRRSSFDLSREFGTSRATEA